MKTLRYCIALSATTLVLAGCGADAEPKFEADPSPTAPTSATPTPDEPEPWEEKSDEGAIAFVEHWVDVFNASTSSGDTKELRAFSSPDCETCSNFARLTESIYAAGGSVDGGVWTVASKSEPQRSNGVTFVSIDIDQAPQTVVQAADEKPERYPGGKVDYLAGIQWSKGGWRMLRMDVVQ